MLDLHAFRLQIAQRPTVSNGVELSFAANAHAGKGVAAKKTRNHTGRRGERIAIKVEKAQRIFFLAIQQNANYVSVFAAAATMGRWRFALTHAPSAFCKPCPR